MSLKLLRIILRLRKILALTPSSEKNITKTNSSQKLYALTMAGILTVALGISTIYRIPLYLENTVLGLLIQILLDSTLYVSNMYTILTSYRKNRVWYELLKNLKLVEENNKLIEKSNLFQFIFFNALFLGCQSYMTFWGYNSMGVDYFKQLSVEYLQTYDVLVINFLMYIILKMLLLRYRALTKELKNRLSLFKKYGRSVKQQLSRACSKIKNDICLLKICVDIVNDIFGWPFLFTIANACLQTLLYLEIIIITPISMTSMLYVLVVIFWQYIYVLVNIFLCESVSNEAKKMVDIAYSFEKSYIAEIGDGHEDLQQFMVVVKDNMPTFTAARFFYINRMTLFSIFNVVITFLIVMVQFESTRTSTCQVICDSSGIRANYSSLENETVSM